MKKTCVDCKIEKETTEYWKKKTGVDGLCACCSDCAKIRNKKSRAKNIDAHNAKQRLSYQQNREARKESMKADYQKNKETRLEYASKKREQIKKDVEENGLSLPDISEKRCTHCLKTKTISDFYIRKTKNCYTEMCKPCKRLQSKHHRQQDEYKEKRKVYLKEYTYPYSTRILQKLRARGILCLKNLDKKTYANKTLSHLDCSQKILKQWFYFNLDLDNYTFSEYGNIWNIDHVLPCNIFDVDNKEDMEFCFHWTNTRPCGKIKNSKKGSFIYWFDLFVHEIRLKKFIEQYQLNANILSQWKNRALTTAALGKFRA